MSDENEEYVITIADVEAELPPQDYETLTLGDDNVAVRCLVKAKVFVKGMIASTGHEYDEHNDVCREAVLKRALYELFAFVGQEERAREISFLEFEINEIDEAELIPGEEEDVITRLPAAAPAYTILMDASSLSA